MNLTELLGAQAGAILDGSPLSALLLMLLLGLIPFALLSVTSFVKLSVVFGILRSALGAQQIPSAAVTSLLSLVLTLHIMSPVASEVAAKAEVALSGGGAKKNAIGAAKIFAALSAGREPLQNFLARNSRFDERVFFIHPGESSALKIECADGQESACLLPGEGFMSLIPAFVLSELHAAFAAGFILFLPFLVIDLFVANLLVGVGMTMVSPITISLPLKILAFVCCDAWFALCRSLVLSYAH